MIRHPPWWVWIVTAALVTLVIWAPLPFGSVEPAAAAWIRLAAFCAAGLAVAVAGVDSVRRVRAPALSLAGIALLGWVQSLRWPSSIVGVVSPGHLDLGASVETLAGSSSQGVALSLAPDLSRVAALNWLAAAALVVAAAAVGAHRWPRRLAAAALLATAGFEVVYGLRNLALGSYEIWGREAPSSWVRLRGTYVNANHLATYVEIALSVVLAVTWWGWRRSRTVESLERRLLLVGLPALAWVALLAAMALSGSRAGLLVCLGGAVVQAFVVLHRADTKRLVLGGAGVLALGLGAVSAVGLRQGLRRFFEAGLGAGLSGRLEADVATLGLWTRFPVLGTGLGSYREVFPLVQPTDLPGSWWHAHNDYVELLATVGALGFAIFAVGLFCLVRRLWRVWRRGRRSEDRAVALAALGAIAAVGVHELVDFGMTLPGNWVPMAVLCGMAAAVPTGRGSRLQAGPRALRPESSPGDEDPG